MLEGLEISEVRLSYVLNNNDVFRFDSNYFQKEFIREENLIRSKRYKTLKKLDVSLLSFGAYSLNNFIEYKDEGVPFIRGVNMKKGRVSFSDIIYIDAKSNALLWKSEVKPETVLLSMSGTIGDVAIASRNWNYPINSNQDIAKINTNSNLNPYYLFAFLLGKFGQNYLKREARGSVQQHVFLSQMELFEIPLYSKDFEQMIQKLIEYSDSLLECSEQNYSEAENLLLETLGLKNFQLSQEITNVKRFSESFGSSGRLDAEYYQLKYEDYESLITSYSIGYESFATACKLKDYNFTPEIKTEYKYIELANIGKSGEITDCTIALGEELPTRARRKVNTNDVVVSSIEGSLESCALVTSEYNNALCSTGFYVVNSTKLNPETLLILFKSEPIQALLKKGCSGTILTAISKTELEQIPIPLIALEIQKKIKEQVNESFELRKKSEYLLEVAKTAVETAIAQDEKIALQYISQNF